VPKTLLLADGSPAIQRIVALTFAGEDIDVVPMTDGDQAVEALKKTRPDVVIADVATAGRSGYDIADYIRQSADLARVPVLLLSSALDPVDPARAHAVGARGVLTKPFAPAALVGRVRELLQVPHEGPASALPPVSTQPSPADEYFEQIDRAFAELKSTGRPPHPPGAHEPDESRAEEGEATDASLAPAPLPVHRPVSLSDAFSAMLAAESGDPVAASFTQPGETALPPIDMDALVDRIVTRVLETMSDQVVRATVGELVSAAAERLVREEIERIKRAIE
jgi:CheY-like chemotaxis protein